MAGLLDLFGGGGSDPMDIYGDLFTEKQRAALRDQQMTQGLLNAAAVFSKAGQASRLPVSIPWGEAAQALGGSGDEAMNRMLKGMQVAEEVRSSRQKRGFADQVAEFARGLLAQEKQLGLPQGTLVKPYLAATGGATGGAPASNAPAYQNPDMGDVPAKPMAAPTATDAGDYLPGKAAGLLNPAAYGGSGGGLPGQGVLASLGGGEAGVPLPFGQGSPGSPDLSNIKIEQLSGEAAPAGDDKMQRDLALIRKYESGGRNIEQQVVGPQGGYNPSVGRVTGPSSASGLYQMIDPTWRHAAQQAGIDTSQYPRAIDAPEPLQTKAAEALYREQGLKPWAPYNSRLAAAAGQGASGRDNIRIEPLGGEAAPAGTAPAGKIPGLNISPQGLAALNMLSKLGGLGEPFGSLLETYYKSPDYLGNVKRQSEQIETEFAGPKAAAQAAATQKYIQENETHKSSLDLARDLIGKGVYLDKETGTMKPITNADQAFAAIHNAKEKFKSENELVTTTLTFPGEARPRKLQMTRAQAADIAKGLPVPALGIPAMTGIKMGEPVYNPTETALGPIEAKAIFENHQLATDAATTIETNKQARALLDGGVITGFGADRVTAFTKLGNALGVTGRTSQEQVANTEAYLATTAGNVGRMIKQFGAGTGLSDADREYAAQMAAGKVTLDETSIRRILDINDRASLNIINRHNQRVSKIAPGATMTDLNVPVPEPYKPPEAKAAAEGPAAAARAGAADAIAKGASRDAVIKRLRDAGISTEGL